MVADIALLVEAREPFARREQTRTHGAVPNLHDDEAVEALSRVIDKADFAEMEVVGQFNLGFIVVRRRKPPTDDGDATVGAMDDLFIVD